MTMLAVFSAAPAVLIGPILFGLVIGLLVEKALELLVGRLP